MRTIKKDEISVKMVYTVTFIGLFLIFAVYGLFTVYDVRRTEKAADKTHLFAKARILRYEDYKENDKVKSLYRLLDKTTEAARCLDKEVYDESFFEDYVYEQRLGGICIFDSDMKCEYFTEDSDIWWKKISDSANIDNNVITQIIEYPLKSYMTRIELDDGEYDMAAVSRRDKGGIVIAYEKKQPGFENNGDITMESLITDFTFENDGIVFISCDDKIVNCNIEEYQGKTLSEYQDVFLEDWNDGGNKMVKFGLSQSEWYGSRMIYGRYGIYVFFPSSSIYSDRTKAVIFCTGAYITMLVLAMAIRQHILYINTRQLDKQFRIIKSISSIYSALILIDIKNDQWELIKIPEKLDYIFDQKHNVKQMLEDYTSNRIIPSQRDSFRKFADINTLMTRLEQSRYLEYTVENINSRWYMIAVVPQSYDKNGHIAAILMLFRDITEEKLRELKYQHQLKAAAQQAEKANVAKTDFLRRMSHDIRTPINGIRGMVEICRFYLNDRKKAEECLDKIMAASGFLLELVNDVLDMNKLESGEIVLTKEPFCLSKLLMEVDSVIEMQADESGVDYIKAPLNIENDYLIGSSLHIKQILQNIVSNAVKYNKRGGYVRVSCTENRIDEKNIMFEFVCTDNGQGMSEDFQKKAFEPFAQEKTRVRTTYTGTGLGLAISKKLTVQMGGTIEFISRQGYGTTFYVKIPFEIDDSYESRQQEISADEKIRLDGNKIIIAEDNELNMEIARFIIEGAGAQVMPAVNGEEAVKIFETSQYGEYKVVLMDVMMPVMGGLEAAQNIRKMDRPDAKTVAMIAMSANAFHDDVEQSLAAGMNVHMAKPLDFDKLLATIKEYCDKNSHDYSHRIRSIGELNI